jgi:hypothetical protein
MTSTTVHPEIQIIDALQLAGWDERSYRVEGWKTTRTFRRGRVPAQVTITNESEYITLRVQELSDKGWATGVEHLLRITASNIAAILTATDALIDDMDPALAEAIARDIAGLAPRDSVSYGR